VRSESAKSTGFRGKCGEKGRFLPWGTGFPHPQNDLADSQNQFPSLDNDFPGLENEISDSESGFPGPDNDPSD